MWTNRSILPFQKYKVGMACSAVTSHLLLPFSSMFRFFQSFSPPITFSLHIIFAMTAGMGWVWLLLAVVLIVLTRGRRTCGVLGFWRLLLQPLAAVHVYLLPIRPSQLWLLPQVRTGKFIRPSSFARNSLTGHIFRGSAVPMPLSTLIHNGRRSVDFILTGNSSHCRKL